MIITGYYGRVVVTRCVMTFGAMGGEKGERETFFVWGICLEENARTSPSVR